jgi:hypothetical protein
MIPITPLVSDFNYEVTSYVGFMTGAAKITLLVASLLAIVTATLGFCSIGLFARLTTEHSAFILGGGASGLLLSLYCYYGKDRTEPVAPITKKQTKAEGLPPPSPSKEVSQSVSSPSLAVMPPTSNPSPLPKIPHAQSDPGPLPPKSPVEQGAVTPKPKKEEEPKEEGLVIYDQTQMVKRSFFHDYIPSDLRTGAIADLIVEYLIHPLDENEVTFLMEQIGQLLDEARHHAHPRYYIYTEVLRLFSSNIIKWQGESRDSYWAVARLQKDSLFWSHTIKFLSYAQQRSQQIYRLGANLRFVTGTKSSTLIGMAQLAKFTGKPALMCTGELLKRNIVPLCGELQGGISANGINNSVLSAAVGIRGLETSISYADCASSNFITQHEIQILMNCSKSLSRMKIAALRLLRYGKLDQSQKDKIETHLRAQAAILTKEVVTFPDWEKYTYLIGKSGKFVGSSANEHLLPGTPVMVTAKGETRWACFRWACFVDIRDGKYMCYDDYEFREFSNQEVVIPDLTAILQDKPEECCVRRIDNWLYFDQRRGNGLLEIAELFKSIQEIVLDRDDENLIAQNFPIVFGVTADVPSFEPISDCAGERCIEEALILGEHVQLIFTPSQYMPQVKKWLTKVGVVVPVLTFEAARYFMLRQLLIKPSMSEVGAKDNYPLSSLIS